MGLMIGISALTIGALAASTMAWYSVSASITVNSSTVSIRTALQYKFYAYGTGNGTTGNGFVYDKANHTYTAGSGYSGTPSDLNDISKYKEVDELDDYEYAAQLKDALTRVSGLWPGYKMSFAVKVEGLLTSDTVSLTLFNNRMNANSPASTTKKIGDTQISMKKAIKLTAGSGSDLATAISNGNTETTGLSYRNYDNSGQLANWDATDGTHVFGTAAPTAQITSWWWFFTIEFSDDNWAHYEKTSTVGDWEIYSQSNSGNSNCFQGLTFNLGTMDLK